MTRTVTTSLVFAVLPFVFPPALVGQQADRWISVGMEAGAEVELDTASVTEIDPDLFEAWLRQDLSEPRLFLVDRYDRRLVLHQYDCRLRRQRLIWFRLLEGEDLVQDRASSDSRWQPILPGSVEETVWMRVCEVGADRDSPVNEPD